jgi:hypothetical protein
MTVSRIKVPVTLSHDEFLTGICAIVPAMTMAAAHWFPWRRLLHRELRNTEAYAIGTVAIVGTAVVSIAASDGDSDDHIRMLLLAALSAGIATLAAHHIDDDVKVRAENAGLKAERDVLHGNF